MIRRPLFVFATFVAVAGLLASAGWYYARHLAFQAVDRWVAEQRADGIAVGWASRTITGWPVRLDGRFDAPRAVVATPARTLTWRGPDANVRFYLLSPHTIDFAAPGRHSLTVDDGGGTATFTLDAKTLDARADNSLTGLTGADISAGGTGLTLHGPGDAPLATAHAVQLFWKQPPAGPPAPVSPAANASDPLPVALEAALRVDGLSLAPGVLPPTPTPILGNDIAVLRANLSVNGALGQHPSTTDALAAWRDAGGTVDISHFEIAWGPVHLRGDGTLALDKALQPEGAFTARVSGLTEILTAMEHASMIDARTAAIARITLAVLTRPSEDGGPPEAQVPLTVQNGVLSVGPVALLKLPKIVWH